MTTLAAMTKRPERFVGMHFMNPVPVMALVEVIRALQTGDAAFDLTMELSKKLGKTPVAVNDAPGFVSNRVLMPLINEAAYTVMEGVATPEAVDTVMKLGMNHPMGPLELADFIGLDVCVDIMHVLHEGLGDPKYRACPLLQKIRSRRLSGPQIRPRLPLLRKEVTVRYGVESSPVPSQGRNKSKNSVCFCFALCYFPLRRFQQESAPASCRHHKTCHPERIDDAQWISA